MRDNEKLTYINIMIDTLKKKEALLKELKTTTIKQTSILEQEEFDADGFDATIDEKQKRIDELLKLDEGFMDLYEKVKDTLINDGKDYAPEIEKAKALIKTQIIFYHIFSQLQVIFITYLTKLTFRGILNP